jgi:AcrR family transcriptional regulator
MAETVPRKRLARDELIAAAGRLLREEGYPALSTRRIAEAAGVPLSQIHYHFGNMRGLLLALLDRENEARLERQHRLYGSDRPLSEQWALACDYLEEDLDSGYVRILLEMVFAGFGDDEIATALRGQLDGWYALLTDVAGRALDELGPLGPFDAEDVALLVGQSFIGLEVLVTLDAAGAGQRGLATIRKLGALIAAAERRTVS